MQHETSLPTSLMMSAWQRLAQLSSSALLLPLLLLACHSTTAASQGFTTLES
jgi:hypothetical protein